MRYPRILTRFASLLTAFFLSTLILLGGYNLSANSNSTPASRASRTPVAVEPQAAVGPGGGKIQAPAVSYTVNSLADTNTGSGTSGTLRFCINASNTAGGTNTLSFSVTGTISLTSSLPDINSNLTIDGPGPSLLTISGNNSVRVVRIQDGHTVTFMDLTIANGNANSLQGGAIDANASTVTLQNCVFNNNRATFDGGAVRNNGGSMTVIKCTFSNNVGTNAATAQGGGLKHNGSFMSVTDSTFINNSANAGGAVHVGTGSPNATFTNCTFYGNTATFGGGIEARESATFQNCTFTRNVASSVGGLNILFSQVTLINTIVAGNLDPNGNPSDIEIGNGGSVNLAASFNNLIGAAGSTGLTDGTNGNHVGVLNPLLAPLGSYGGPTQTAPPLGNSLAINGGRNTGAPATDQRGVSRPTGGTVEIGAVEVNFIVTDNGDAPDSNVGNGTCATAGAVCTLRAAIQEVNVSAIDDYITFNLTSPATITLTSALPTITSNAGIAGADASSLTISGNNAQRVFLISNTSATHISGLKIANGQVTTEGGGISNQGTLTLTRCEVDSNTANNEGGGISNIGTLTIIDSTISNNTSTALDGGGVASFGALAVSGSTFIGNSANVAGGGIAVMNGGPLNGSLAITNSTFSANQAAVTGGGISFDTAMSNTITNCTISQNEQLNAGSSGGGLGVAAGTVTLKNTFIAGNIKNGGTQSDITVTGGTVSPSSSFNLIGTGGAGGLTNGVNNNQVGVTNTGLAPLGNYGGPTQTYALGTGSVALNAGTNTGAPTTDQRGVARPVNGAVDIGAFESNITVTPSSIPTGTVGAVYPSQTFSAAGGSGDYTFSESGTLPTGMFFSPVGADLSGTPTQSGSFPICILAMDNTNGFVGVACYTLTINAQVLHHFAIANITSPKTAGTPFNITITARDSANNTVLGFTGTVNLSTNAGTITPTTSGAFTSGALTQSVTLTQSGAGKTISVNDDSGHTGTSNTFTVNPGALDHFAIANINTPQVAGIAFNISLTAQDANNNTVPSFNSTVSLNTNAGTITPTTSGSFTSGTRTQSVTVTQAGTGRTISVNDASGHTATSNAFTLTNTLTWAGSSSADWNTAANWTPAVVPSATHDVDIPASGVTNNPTLSSSPITINNLSVAAGRTLTLNGQNLTVNGSLNLSGGIINTGSNTLNLGPSATISRTSGQVMGNLKKTFSGAGSFIYPVGTANGYSPVDVTVTAGSGDLSVRALQGNQPLLNSANSLRRYWTLTGTGVTVNMVFHYLDPTDIAGNESAYRLIRVSSGNAVTFPDGCASGSPCVNPAANTATITGVSSFSDWTLGEPTAPTAVEFVSFNAARYDNGALLEWQTGFEAGNLGFNLYRDEDGKRTLVNPQIIAGSALVAGSVTMRAGRSYVWWDRLDERHDNPAYYVEDIDLNGNRALHGPFNPRVIGGKPPAQSQAELLSNVGKNEARISYTITNQSSSSSNGPARTATQSNLAAQSGAKLTVREAGFYRVTQPELIRAGIAADVDPRRLQLYIEGIEVPMIVMGESDGRFDATDAVEFYATALDSTVTDARICWLVMGSQPGKRISLSESKAKPAGAQSFYCTVESKERSLYFSGLLNGEAENFFGRVITSQPVEQTIPLRHLDANAPGGAELEVALQGVMDLEASPDHIVSVALNGVMVGRLIFDGRQHKSERFSIYQSLLREGNNTVTMMAEGGSSDISLVDYIRVSYSRSAEADDDLLQMTAQAGTQTIGGFSTPQIRVFDVSAPAAVVELSGPVIEQSAGYGVTVTVAGSGARTLLALTDERIKQPAAILANQPSSLRQPANGANLLIITRKELAPSLAPLIAQRQQQGLSVAVADIQDVYDEWSFGQKSPQAVKDFLAYAATSWKKKPRYALLVGDASFDPKGYLGFGETDLVPTKLIDTDYMETASDDWLADFDNDGLPELALGRLPARTASQALTMAVKIVSYDSQPSAESVLLVSDLNDTYNFKAASRALQALVAQRMEVETLDRGDADDETMRAKLIEAINNGQWMVNYAGHGSVGQWRGNLLTEADVSNLNNADRLPMFVMMTCLNGYFQDAAGESLGESLLKSDRGGAVAVWASSGMTIPDAQAMMNQETYRQLFNGQHLTIGEAILRAKAVVSNRDVRRTWILLGDPTTRLK